MHSIMIQGTGSNVGKSVLSAGLCRLLKQDGFIVAPFKSQNMALNSFITADGHEIGRAQAMQAQCAGADPDWRHNPILLKPTGDTGSQVVVAGKPIGNMSAREYFAFRHTLIPTILDAYHSLAEECDVIVIEGAGSPAEINLKEGDIVNMGLAKLLDAPVLLCGDIDRGGVFASLYGTIALLEPEEQALVKGVIINKFRGDLQLLRPGLQMLEDKINRPVLGVVPYLNLLLDDEDSLADRLTPKAAPQSSENAPMDIAVIRTPKISNFTDFNPLETMPNVVLRYVQTPSALGTPDLVILPGSKNTMADTAWLFETGFAQSICAFAQKGGVVFGICGGFQMMGRAIRDPHGVEGGGQIDGLGLLDHTTLFHPADEKILTQVSGAFGTVDGLLSGLSGKPFTGFEIHMGRCETAPDPTLLSGAGRDAAPLESGQRGNLYGCYVHGIFDAAPVREGLLQSLCAAKNRPYTPGLLADAYSQNEAEYDKLAAHLRLALDLDQIYQICGLR